MYEVRVECDFSAAHFLRDYSGKCERLHGHNYKVHAYVKGHVLGECGMLLDFATLKHALANVCGTLEHTNLNDMPVFLQNPSAERIAQYVYNELIECMKRAGYDLSYSQAKTGAYVSAIDVFETPVSRARYLPE